MGPLAGIRVIEMSGLAPFPFAGMMLADLGADVVRIDNAGRYAPPAGPLDRGKSCVEVNLKEPAGLGLIRELAAKADVLLEGYRPGVAERLGIGPDDLARLNPRLIYGRLTGWGQDGPLAPRVGHDINYIALTGVLDVIGRKDERPVPPANLVADFAGGGMLLAAGVMGALFERDRSGMGQVIDAAMVDGGAAYYDTYPTADGKYVAVGAVEPEFFATLTAVLDLDDAEIGFQLDPSSWPQWRTVLAEKFREKTRDEWAEIFADVDACVSPMLTLWEAPEHPHHVARGAFIEVDGVRQPAPAPRFSRTAAETPAPLRVLLIQTARSRW